MIPLEQLVTQTVETFLRIYIDCDQRDWVKHLFITEIVINNKNAASTGVNPFYFSHGYHAKILTTNGTKLTYPDESQTKNLFQKTDNIHIKKKKKQRLNSNGNNSRPQKNWPINLKFQHRNIK